MAGAAALLLVAGTGVWWLTGHLPSPAGEDLAPLPGDGLVTFARIQTAMNRAAAGKPALPSEGADPLEAIGAALREFLAGNTVGAAHLLDDVEAEIDNRVPSDEQVAADPLLADKEEWLVSYFELLPEPESGKGIKADTYVFDRFAVVMRKVDAVLLAEILPTLKGYDLVARKSAPDPSVFDGMMLRFPCRLAASHRTLLEDAAKTLSQMGDQPGDRAEEQMGVVLTDCPAPKGHETDFALLERIARDPAGTLMVSAEGSVPLPRDLRTKLMTAAARGKLADITAALEAGADPQRADARGRTALHYLLGNPAVGGAARAAAIKLLY